MGGQGVVSVSWVVFVGGMWPCRATQADRRLLAVLGVRLQLQAQQLHQVPYRVPAPGPHGPRLPLRHLQQVLPHQERPQVSPLQKSLIDLGVHHRDYRNSKVVGFSVYGHMYLRFKILNFFVCSYTKCKKIYSTFCYAVSRIWWLVSVFEVPYLHFRWPWLMS